MVIIRLYLVVQSIQPPCDSLDFLYQAFHRFIRITQTASAKTSANIRDQNKPCNDCY